MSYCRNCGSQLPETDNFCETCGTVRRGAASKAPYTGKTCPYCQFPLKADSDVTLCSACGIPHHRECWAENGGCTTFGCGGLTVEPGNQLGAMETTTITEAGQAAGEMLEVSFDESPIRQVKGLESSLSSTAAGNTGQWESGKGIYKLTYQTGELPLHDLPIGARVVDPTWAWEFRTGNNYTGAGEQKPVVWIVVAKNHYEGLEPHVTLLAEELIGKHVFDNSTNRSHRYAEYGYNKWGDSGTANATFGLRPWLNSSGIHANEGFYRAFSVGFKKAVIATTLPNKVWENGSSYITQDYVFIPSTTEMGDSTYNYRYQIGATYAYFDSVSNVDRMACFSGKTWWYWTRSPDPFNGFYLCLVHLTGEFGNYLAKIGTFAVRPALNLKADTLVYRTSGY